ncbi:DNA excision repair protein ERCC-1 [Nymphaea thermarum]|nr:DNA excision repair protein ERCC-1 [Nymphaea thermarum]
MEKEEEERKKKKVVIEIPSYREVLEGSEPRLPPPNLFRPSSSFSEAFSFVKNSEFYTPPPPPSPPPSTTTTPQLRPSGTTPEKASRQTSSASSSPSPSSSATSLGRNAILVNHRQQGNPLLKHIRNVRWSFSEIIPDYLLGQNSCALYLSLRYHLLHPDYIYHRIRELQKNYRLRVVLCHIDVEDVVKPLLEVTRTALLHDCTLLCGWSLEECGRYLETIKMYENKPADIIQERTDTDYLSRMNHALTSIRHINKSDVVTLGSAFGSLSGIMDASMEDLARCPGIGERKVKRLFDTFHEPFKRAIPSRTPAVPSEAPVVENPNPCSENGNNDVIEEEAGQIKPEKEPALTVKSALTAALSKYSKRLHNLKGSASSADQGGISREDTTG